MKVGHRLDREVRGSISTYLKQVSYDGRLTA